MRPQRGSRATSKIGASPWWAPMARSWRAKLVASALQQPGIPRGGEADRLREAHRVACDEAVQALLVDDGRDPQPRLLHEEALDLVGQRGHDGHLEARRARDPRDLPDAGGQALLGLAGVDVGAVEDLEDPDRAELGELLLERHPAHEVVDAIGDRERRIEVGRGGDAQPFTAPVVRPLMSWRSANA